LGGWKRVGNQLLCGFVGDLGANFGGCPPPPAPPPPQKEKHSLFKEILEDSKTWVGGF